MFPFAFLLVEAGQGRMPGPPAYKKVERVFDMNLSRWKSLLALLFVFTLVAAACSGDEVTEAADDAADAVEDAADDAADRR